MSKVKRVRWECQSGTFCSAVLGPSRPRSDDACRYCLACSARTGRLVRRVPPALEKKREARAAQIRARAAAKKERDAAREASYYTVAGLDVRAEMARILKLPIFYGEAPNDSYRAVRLRPPSIRVRRVSPDRSAGVWKYGHADRTKNEMLIVVTASTDKARVQETIAHELAHFAAPRTVHGVAWRTAFRLICEHAFGFRPRLEDGRYSAREVEPLLRAKEVLTQLSPPGPMPQDQLEALAETTYG